jgi:hypothetical protein
LTTCIVAQFPWTAIANVTQAEPQGVIVCSDTKMTSITGHARPGVWKKQGPMAKNILVCYTSNNVGATISALGRVSNTRNVERISRSLRDSHQRYNGFTELIAVVWHGDQTPQILELMPPDYEPTPRSGIIGIGDNRVLDTFRENFFEAPRPDLRNPPSPEMLERLAQHIGQPVEPPRYTVHDASLNVASALVEAIQIQQPTTVRLPIQIRTISLGRVTSHVIMSSSNNGQTWTRESAHPQEVLVPPFQPGKVDRYNGPRRSARQLFK